MYEDKVNRPKKNRVNWKILVLIVVVILAGIGLAVVQEFIKDKYLRIVPIEKHLSLDSEKGKNLTTSAEKALEKEGIDLRYLFPLTIIESSSYNPSSSPVLRFSGTKTFYSAKVYSNHNLTDIEANSVFAADLNRYSIDFQSYGEIWEYGKNYSLNISNNALEIIDRGDNRVKLKILNYSVIQNEEQTGAIVDEINGQFEKAQREFRIGQKEPVVIIDAPSHTGNLKNMGNLLLEVGFCGSQPCSIRIEEESQENESKGWVEVIYTRRIKYLNISKAGGAS
ncbi:MAG: hypothetical protein FIB08_02575 [Candidatus Methanoperedens sp.]|nr:hypothetical protein [Candidatus Methanoperedens sp.]